MNCNEGSLLSMSVGPAVSGTGRGEDGLLTAFLEGWGAIFPGTCCVSCEGFTGGPFLAALAVQDCRVCCTDLGLLISWAYWPSSAAAEKWGFAMMGCSIGEEAPFLLRHPCLVSVATERRCSSGSTPGAKYSVYFCSV